MLQAFFCVISISVLIQTITQRHNNLLEGKFPTTAFPCLARYTSSPIHKGLRLSYIPHWTENRYSVMDSQSHQNTSAIRVSIASDPILSWVIMWNGTTRFCEKISFAEAQLVQQVIAAKRSLQIGVLIAVNSSW